MTGSLAQANDGHDRVLPISCELILAANGQARCLQGLSDHVKFQPGVPVKPMLAKPMTGISEVLDKFANTPFTCEWKYDGERAQVHVTEGTARRSISSWKHGGCACMCSVTRLADVWVAAQVIAGACATCLPLA